MKVIMLVFCSILISSKVRRWILTDYETEHFFRTQKYKIMWRTSIHFYVGRHETQIVVRIHSGQSILKISCQYCVTDRMLSNKKKYNFFT